MADSFIPDAPQVSAGAGQVQGDSFQPDSFQPDSPNSSGQDSFTPMESPEHQKYIQPEETRKIAEKYQVDPKRLESIAPYHGVNLITDENPASFGAKAALGEAGRMALVGYPIEYAYKHLQMTEPERRALDELKAESEARKGTLEKGVEFTRGFAAPAVGVPRMLGKTAPKVLQFGERLTGSSGIGAGIGALSAPEGQEAEGAKEGAKWGAILHTGLEGVGVLANIKGKPKAAETKPTEPNRLPDIEGNVDRIAKETAQSEKVAADSLSHILETGEAPKLSDEQVDLIYREQYPEGGNFSEPAPRLRKGKSGRDTSALEAIPTEAEGELTAPISLSDKSKRDLAEQFIEDRLKGYAHDLTRKPARNLEEAAQMIQGEFRRGNEYLADRYGEFVRGQMAEKAGTQVHEQRGFWGKSGDYFSDAQYVLRDIDRRTGTALEPILSKMNQAYNKSTYVLDKYRRKLDQVFRANRKTVDGDTLYTQMRALEKDGTPIDPTYKAAADRVRGFFDQFHEQQTSSGGDVLPLGTEKLPNYVPEYAKPVSEIVPLVERRISQAERELGGRRLEELGPQELEQLQQTSEPVRDIVQFAKWGNPEQPITSGAQLQQVLDHSLKSSRGRQSLELVAKSSLERKGGTPDFLLEKNIYKLMDMYTANTVRAMYLRKGMDTLRYQMRNLEKAGATEDADYVRKLIQDIQGTRPGTAAAANRDLKIAFYRNLDRMIDSFGGKDSTIGGALTAVKALPDVLREISLQIYPASMGLNIRSAIQNSTSAVTKLAPELGGAYGYTTTLRAAVASLHNFREQYAQVRASGMLPRGFVRNGEAAIAEGLQASALYEIPRKMLDGLSKGLMALHTTTEAFNRVLTKNVGEIMGREVAAGNKAAIAALNRFPGTIRKQVAQMGNDGQAIGGLLARHLNDTTQYNYNRLSMNEFGRSFGPMFSVFTKWPAATAGDIIATMRSQGKLKGSMRVLEKYLAPALLLHGTSMAIFGHSLMHPSEDMTDREKQIAGQNGLVQAAPIGNILGLVRGDVGMPPALALGYHGIIQPLVTGKGLTPEQGQRVAGQFVQSFAPGAGLVRFLTQDLVTYLTGHKPEGDFFQRTQEGAKRLEREIGR